MIRGNEAVEKLKRLGFNCQQCGNCCRQLGKELTISNDEIKNWQEDDDLVFSNFGYHFLEDFIDIIPELECADLWFHPVTGDELRRCPFLRKKKEAKYKCLIYDLRPDACKIFPIYKSTGEIGNWTDICPEVRRLNTTPFSPLMPPKEV